MTKSGFAHESTAMESDEWYTLPEVFERLGLEFDLDVCGPLGGVEWIPAKKTLSLKDDGLTHRWTGRVWMNPPYGTQTPKWMQRFGQHHNGVALVFSRTDTRWFHDIARVADLLCFLSGRLRFIRPNGDVGGTPGAGSLLIACGDDNAYRVLRSGLGLCVRRASKRKPITALGDGAYDKA